MNALATPEVVRGGVLAFDGFELDVPGFELRCEGLPVAMEPQVFEVLKVLVEEAGNIVTKDEILDKVWPERYVTEAALNSRVMAARKALGDNGKDQKYIKTIHGRGYRFVGQVRQNPVTAVPRVAAVSVVEPETFPASAATSFVGRERELAQLTELSAGASRFISIVGPGGIGKTRLAMKFASRQQAAFANVVYVPLETLGATELAPAMAAAIGFKPSGDDVVAELVRQLATTEMTFVLDNFEHLVDGGRNVVARLIDGTGGVRFVVTSRVVLGLRGEWVFRTEGLGLEAEDGQLSEAGRLFVAREQQADAAGGGGADVTAVNEICRLVAGMPLAIELAAALRRYLGYGEIAELVTNDLSSLTANLHDAPERHRSIEALLDESCRYLPADELRVLHALGVFEGSFTSEAARVVAGASLPTLRSLVDSSLVQPGSGRFSLHPLMRQLIQARGGEELEPLRERHACYYARFLSSRTEALEGAGQLQALTEMDAEYPNINAAWRWAAAARRVDLIEEGRHAFACYLTFRGKFFEARELTRTAIVAAEGAGDAAAPTLAGLLVHEVWTLFRLGQPAAAVGTLQRAAKLTAQTGIINPGIAMDPRVAMAGLRVGTGEYEEAYQAALAALKSAQQREDLPAVAFASWMAGVARFRQVDLDRPLDEDGKPQFRPRPSGEKPAPIDEARRLIEQAARILEDAGELWLRGYVEIERGLIAAAHGDSPAACEHYRTSYELRREIGDPQGMGSALIYLSGTLAGMGYFAEASQMHAEARAVFERVGDATGLAEVERTEAFRYFGEGDFDRARMHFIRGLERSMAMNFANNVLGILRGMADLLLMTGKTELATRVLNAIAWSPAATPFTRGGAQWLLESLNLPIDTRVLEQGAMARLAQEVVETVEAIEEWPTSYEPKAVERCPEAERAIQLVPQDGMGRAAAVA